MATIDTMTDEEVEEALSVKRDPNRQLLRLYTRRDEILEAGEEWANGDKRRRDADLKTVQDQIAMLENSLLPCIEFCEVEVE